MIELGFCAWGAQRRASRTPREELTARSHVIRSVPKMSGGRRGTPIGRVSHVGDLAATLLARMGTILGSPAEARLRLESALRASGRATIPDDPELVMRFVRAFLVGPLVALCGPRVVSLFVEDLEQAILPQSDVRPRMRDEAEEGAEKKRVGLLDDEPYRRSGIARVLIQAGLDVVVLEADQLRDADVDVLVALGNKVDSAVLRDVCMPVVLTRKVALAGEVVAKSTAPRDIAEAVLSILSGR